MELATDIMAIWQKEFEQLMRETYPHRSLETSDGKFAYEDRDVFYWFTGFLMAKRNMPVIELPEKDHYYLDDDVYDADEVHSAINKVGYKYKIKGE